MVSPSMVLVFGLVFKTLLFLFKKPSEWFSKQFFLSENIKIYKKNPAPIELMRLCNRISVETVSELEGMIQSQNQVMAKLKDECHNLTQRLEESSERHK